VVVVVLALAAAAAQVVTERMSLVKLLAVATVLNQLSLLQQVLLIP
jgi:hypothetical protein